MKIYFQIFVLLAFVYVNYCDVIRLPIRRNEKISKNPQQFFGFLLNFNAFSNGSETLIPYFPFYSGIISVGTPPQELEVTFSTSVENLWLVPSVSVDPFGWGNGYNYSSSSSYKPDGEETTMNYYIFGTIGGTFSYDDVEITGLKIDGQRFVQAKDDLYMTNDGVLGLFPNSTGSNTILNNLVRNKLIREKVFSLYFDREEDGELLLGGVNQAHFRGDFHYVPNVSNKTEWAIKIDSVDVGNQTVSINASRQYATIESSAPFIIGPQEEVEAILKAIGVDSDSLFTVDCSEIGGLPKVTFNVDAKPFSLEAEDYVIKLDIPFVGTFCLVPIIPNDTDSWSLGTIFLEKFYSTFDFEQNRIGFAERAPK